MVCVLLTNGPSCAKNPITHIGLSCSMVRGTSFPCVRLTAERRIQTHLSSSLVGFVWLARIFTLWDFLSAGQFLTFPPNFMRTFPESETEKFETTWHIFKCWYTSKLKLLTSFGGESVDTQLESVGSRKKVVLVKSSIWENLPNFLHYSFFIIVISVNTFSMDTFCDLWCM